MKMNKLLIKYISIIMLLSILITSAAYIFSPNISYATESIFTKDLTGVGLITTSNETGSKVLIKEHSGYNGKGFGNKSAIDSFLASYTNVHDDDGLYSWLNSLKNNDSIFCSYRGKAFPNTKASKLATFHGEDVETHIAENKDNMLAYVGTEKVDYVEHLPNKDKYKCTGGIDVLAVNWTTDEEDTEEPYKTKAYEKDFKYPYEKAVDTNNGDDTATDSGSGEPDDYTQVTLVNVQYTATARTFNTHEAYYLAYSNPNAAYNVNPAQNANWIDKTGWSNDAGKELYAISIAVDELDNSDGNLKFPEMDKTAIAATEFGGVDHSSVVANSLTESFNVNYGSNLASSVGTGTMLDGSDYIIGPIYMNNYDYAWCNGAEKYSGKDVKDYPGQLINGIIKATIKLDGNAEEIELTANNFGYYTNADGSLMRNESRATFQKTSSQVEGGSRIGDERVIYEAPGLHPDKYIYPTPDSYFYIRIPISSCVNSTIVEEIKMTYLYHTAEGSGGDLTGFYYQLTWTGQKDYGNGCNPYGEYICPNTDSHGHTCAGKNRTSALAIDDVTYYAHNFECNAAREFCKYGSKASATYSVDQTYGTTQYTDKITTECSSTWKCGKYAHQHGDSVLNDYQKEDGNEYLSCVCSHSHVAGCYKLTCTKSETTPRCGYTQHTHASNEYCNSTKCKHKDCDEEGYCTETTTDPVNNPKECKHTCGDSCCGRTYHDHVYGCYHHHDGNTTYGGDCYSKVCGHTPNSTSCEQFALGIYGCCKHDEHWHTIGSCGKTHDCSKPYCEHGFPTAVHNCYFNTDGTEHASTESACEAEDWGSTHIGRCKGKLDSDEPSRCKHGHANCKKLIWKVREESDVKKIESQNLLWVGACKVHTNDYSCTINNIPLLTKVEINKYIYDVEHTTDLGKTNNDTYKASDDRAKLTEEQKEAFPVYVEKGDEVTYKIVLKNSSAFDVSVRVDDILPKGDFKFVKANIGGTDVTEQDKLKDITIGIAKNSESSFTVTIRVEALEGTYENKARIITRNGQDKSKELSTEEGSIPDIDFIRSTDNGDNGPIVNSESVTTTNPIKEPEKLESSDFYTLNNYNAFIDKYLYKYDQVEQEANNAAGYTKEASIVNDDDVLLVSRENTDETMKEFKDTKDEYVTDKRRTDNGAKETYKKERPVNVEKGEKVTYAIKVTNDASEVKRDPASGTKYATQVRPSEVKDLMHKGLNVTKVTAEIYEGKTLIKDSLSVTYSGPTAEGEFNEYTITLDNKEILKPGQHLLFLVEAQVLQSNMYLPLMENKAELVKVTNINSTDNTADDNTKEIEVTERNIAEHRITSEFIRMKDLIIAGKVWVDFDRDGIMNDTADADRLEKYGLTGINANAMKDYILVSLYKQDGTLVRTTRTDGNGFFTFGREEAQNYSNLNYHATFNYNNEYNSSTTYQRVDKATGKDANGNYTSGSQYINYYIQYEYDGVVYKSTEIYAGTDNLSSTNDGTYNEEYPIDSNAAERIADREEFNDRYKYVSYNILRDKNKNANADGVLTFNKEGHISTLDESALRKMKATSFIDLGTNKINYLWLFPFNGGVSNEIPETDYLKFINLGLELREDVDIALSKDVYSVSTLIDGEEIEYTFNKKSEVNGDGNGEDYIINSPYGLELYESDYKKRVDQYISQAVRNYKGIGSELNVDVTYRITVDHLPTIDDIHLPSNTDTKLDVKIHEILDLYDKNFMTYSDTETIDVKVKNDAGFLETEHRRISEAWYFKEGTEGTKYKKVAIAGEKPVFVENPEGTYVKVPLIVSNDSIYSSASGDYSGKANNFEEYGYKTMYIRTKNENDIVLAEGESFDIYVRYTLDKEQSPVKTNVETYQETKTETEIEKVNIEGQDVEFSVIRTATDSEVLLNRSLQIAEDVANKINPRGIENIAQVNAYSVHYDNGDPAALVDVDSNAGNVGVGEGRDNRSEGNPDDVSLYEDMTYKTGIEIIANNTENDKTHLEKRYGSGYVEIVEQKNIFRDIKGKVWDDSKTEQMPVDGEPGAMIYYADGRSDTSKAKLDAAKDFEVKTNENVRVNYDLASTDDEKNEKTDLPVRNVKAEFIEIVQTAPDRYYEQTLREVTWDQEQQVRTGADGTYELKGLTPGKYIVRFTYGDTIADTEPDVTSIEEAREDMRIFNGQDYKSTKYTIALADDETDVDTIIQSFNAAGTSDARDDEMRRLTVNKYSEVMTNRKAEILKGLINDEDAVIANRYNPLAKNSSEELQELTDKTFMHAETVEFTIKPEKLNSVQKYITAGLEEDGGIYYDVQTIIIPEDTVNRKYIIENLDFGIEYRPESQISLTKEINEMKLTAEDGTLLVDLYFYTEGEGKNTIHKIDQEKSKGLDVVQFVTNKYENGNANSNIAALVNKIAEEDVQGFVYIQVDDEILQGATVEITYKFYAQNNSEIDMIRDSLDEIRYKENKTTLALINEYKARGHEILDENYTASGTAENAVLSDLYRMDEFATKTVNDYIQIVDKLENEMDPILKADLLRQKEDILANNLYRTSPKVMTTDGDNGYYGRFVGYGYYTGYSYPNNTMKAKDVIACLKFDKILDYIDTNLEYTQETNNDKLENRFWMVTDPSDLTEHVYALRTTPDILTDVGKLTNADGQEYNSLVVSVDDSLYDNMDGRVPDNAATLGSGIVNNKNLSRFLLPSLADETVDKTQSKGFIFLPTSKVIAAETSTDDLQYENIAEIIQFTTVTGRRTNFETTIGNANVHAIDTTTPDRPNIGSEEFETASYEPDTAATETITLTPPTGLMLSRRAIVNVVEGATKGIAVTTIAAAVVGIVMGVTFLTRLIIKKRRIK